MNADLRTTYRSPTVTVTEFLCHEEPHAVSEPEQTAVHAFSFVRHGSFEYETGGARTEVRTHHILLENAGEHHVVRHQHTCGDECVIVEIPHRILDEVRRVHWKKEARGFRHRRTDDRLFPLTLFSSTPALEYLQRWLVHPTHADGKPQERLVADAIALRLVSELFATLYRSGSDTVLPISSPQPRSHHLEIVERAREFMFARLAQDLSLSEIAAAAYASEFHFSRIFKAVTGHSPRQYLLGVRLSHALFLLQETKRSVTEIADLSGFNSLSHFVATFSGKYGVSPTRARTRRNIPAGR